jgi:2-polyprenyl-3-methyl-5-hydroxy-6-metoxy-1,4-benzoquinol methylase
MERTTGWRAILSTPWIFELVQHAVGARAWVKRFVRQTIKPVDGEKMLDVGCGPAAILNYLPAIDYWGIDRSDAYIRAAQERFGQRGHFRCDDVSALHTQHEIETFDIATAIGILHHIGDREALALLADIRDLLKPGGRFFTADPCFFPGQPTITRAIVSADRGGNVRTFDQYVALARQVFPSARGTLDASLLPFPRSVCVLACRKE